jgi:hypothetical protein
MTSPKARWAAEGTLLGGGLGGAGIYNMQADRINRKAEAAGREIPAVAQANIAKANARPTPPAEWERALGKARDWAGNNWGWLAGGGAALGGLALLAHQQAQRRKEEDEEELLQGLAKTGTAGLLAEFPVQVGFLARCGERGLSGGEVRAAVEKCAALSDDIAEDWIRFFADAARSEAGTSSGLVKAAQNPGFDATGNPVPVPAVTPKLTPRLTPRGPDAPAPATVAPAKVPAPAKAPAPDPRIPTGGAPYPTNRANPGEPGVGTASYRAPTPRPGDYLTNQQRQMTVMPEQADYDRRGEWMQQVYAAGRPLGDASLTPEQRAEAQANLKAVIAAEPRMAGAGLAGANRELPGRGAMRNLAAEGERAGDPWAHLTGTTDEAAAAGQEAERAALAQGATPEAARKANLMATGRNRGAGGAAWRAAVELPGMIGGMASMPFVGAYDLGKGLFQGDWRFRNTAGAAIEAADPVTQAVGLDPFRAAGHEGLFGRTHAGGTGQVAGTQSHVPGSAAYLASPERQEELSRSAGSLSASQADALRAQGHYALAALPEYSEQIMSTIGSLGLSAPGLANAAGWAGPATIPGKLLARVPGGGMVARGVNALTRLPGAAATAEAAGGLLPKATGAARALAVGLGMSGPEAALAAAQEAAAGATGEQQRSQREQRLYDISTGNIPPTMEDARKYAGRPEQRQAWAQDIGDGAARAKNEQLVQAGQPKMTPQQFAAYSKQHTAQVTAGLAAEDRQGIANGLPGMRDAKGGFDPMGKINLDAGSGYDPGNSTPFMDKYGAQIAKLHAMDKESLATMTRALPADVRQRVSSGAPISPEDMAVLQQNKIDPAQVTATAGRVATAGVLRLSQDFGGDVHRAAAAMGTPQALAAALKTNTSFAQAVQQKVATGAAPDFMTAAAQTWEGLGPMGQLLVGGGLAMGLFGLLNSFLGEGGMGSILMTLLGGGAAVAGLHQGGMLPGWAQNPINSALTGLGLGQFAVNPAAKPAAPAPAPATGPGGEPLAVQPAAATAAPAAPAQPGAAAQLGIDVNDPAARDRLAAAPPAEQDTALADMLAARPDLGPKLWWAGRSWDSDPAGVLAMAQEAIPGITMPQVAAMMAAWRRRQGG